MLPEPDGDGKWWRCAGRQFGDNKPAVAGDRICRLERCRERLSFADILLKIAPPAERQGTM
jgi:hypothetical protein